MNLNHANKKIAYQKAREEAVKTMIDKVNNGLALQMELVMLLVLHDKFGFGAKRCEKAILEFEELWDTINKKYVTLEEIADIVKKEIGLNLNEKAVDYVVDRKKG